MGTTQTQPTDQTQQQKLDMCQKQLQTNMKVIQEQLRAANEQVKSTEDRLYKMQEDGGQTMKQINDVTAQISQYKTNIAAKEQQSLVLYGQLRELELQCDQLEKELQQSKSTYDQCMSNQGAFTTNQEIMVALGNVLVASTATALIANKILN